ncbi:MAG: hypothetical protein AB8B48_16345 [Pseudomonadales bacterium]
MRIRITLQRLFVLFGAAIVTSSITAQTAMTHNNPTNTSSGQRIPLQVDVSGDEDINIVRSYFKSTDGSRYFFVPMQKLGEPVFKGLLPAPSLGTKQIEYFFLASTASREIVKSQSFYLDVENDKEAMSRSQIRDAKDVRIDLEDYEKAKEVIDQLGSNPADTDRVPVGSETRLVEPIEIEGFSDFVIAARQEPFLSLASTVAASGTAGASTASAAAATAGGISWGKVALGALALGGGAAAASNSSDDDDGAGGGTALAPTGNEVGFGVPPNGNMQPPFAIELISLGGRDPAVVDVTYNGILLGRWQGTATQSFPLPGVGSDVNLIFVNASESLFEVHWETNGGRETADILANPGDFVRLRTR